MPAHKYLCIHRSSTDRSAGDPAPRPSPAQMQEMFAAWNAWKERFKGNIVDMGSKLAASGRVATSAGVSDGPFVEAKELVGGYMILAADSYEEALAVVQAGPGMLPPGSHIEIRELAGH